MHLLYWKQTLFKFFIFYILNLFYFFYGEIIHTQQTNTKQEQEHATRKSMETSRQVVSYVLYGQNK